MYSHIHSFVNLSVFQLLSEIATKVIIIYFRKILWCIPILYQHRNCMFHGLLKRMMPGIQEAWSGSLWAQVGEGSGWMSLLDVLIRPELVL